MASFLDGPGRLRQASILLIHFQNRNRQCQIKSKWNAQTRWELLHVSYLKRVHQTDRLVRQGVGHEAER